GRGGGSRARAGGHDRAVRAVVRGRREAARPVPGPAARLRRRFQRRAQLHDPARELRPGGACVSRPANPVRGEAALRIGGRERVLRPSFAALVAAEDELGPLFALVERAGAGQLRLAELAALFWHCLAERDGLAREDVGEAVLAAGLAGCAPALRCLLGQILRGTSTSSP